MAGVRRMDQDDTSRVGGGDQEIKVLKEVNELEDEHEQYVDSLRTRLTDGAVQLV
jgi:hypothetical protein